MLPLKLLKYLKYQKLMTCNQNKHIKISDLLMKYSLGKMLEKCTYSLSKSVFHWVVTVAHNFIFLLKNRSRFPGFHGLLLKRTNRVHLYTLHMLYIKFCIRILKQSFP